MYIDFIGNPHILIISIKQNSYITNSGDCARGWKHHPTRAGLVNREAIQTIKVLNHYQSFPSTEG